MDARAARPPPLVRCLLGPLAKVGLPLPTGEQLVVAGRL